MTTTGPNLAGTGAADAAVGTITWFAPSRVTADDASHSDCVNATGGSTTTHYLKATNFGFAIASDQQIDGITVEIERDASDSSASRYVKDLTVKLVIGGAVSGSNLADTVTKYPASSPTIASYGGASTLWGLTPTYSDINDSTFGVVLSCTNVSDSGKVNVKGQVDFVRITITHTTGGGGGGGQPISKRFGGVPFMGSQPLQGQQRWIKRVSGLLTPSNEWRPAHGIR